MIRSGILGLLVVALVASVTSAQYRSRYSRSDSSDDKSKNRYARSSDSSKDKDKGAAGGVRFLSAHERLPSGIPEWFIEKDADKDGQVKMAEFSSQWSEAIVADYMKYDPNFDGFITPSECMQATEAGIVYSGSTAKSQSTSDRSSRYSGSSFGGPRTGGDSTSSPKPTTPRPSTTKPPVASSTPAKTETPATAEKSATTTPAPASGGDDGLPAPSKAYLSYAVRVIAKYDSNGDNKLVIDEWKAMSKNPSAADTSGDGAITPTEYARWLMPKK